MAESNHINQKKNLLYCPEQDRSQIIVGARIHTWEQAAPWNCSTRERRLVATVRPGMQLSYTPGGDYQLSYLLNLDPELHRMRWTCKIRCLNAQKIKLFDFLVDTRELTVHPDTKSWAYQIHTGSETAIARHFEEVSSWERDLSGNGWFKEHSS